VADVGDRGPVDLDGPPSKEPVSATWRKPRCHMTIGISLKDTSKLDNRARLNDQRWIGKSRIHKILSNDVNSAALPDHHPILSAVAVLFEVAIIAIETLVN